MFPITDHQYTCEMFTKVMTMMIMLDYVIVYYIKDLATLVIHYITVTDPGYISKYSFKLRYKPRLHLAIYLFIAFQTLAIYLFISLFHFRL